MAIKSVAALATRKMEIDLTGPQGNAYFLLGAARRLATELDKDADAIAARMKESDYEHLVEVFEQEFGEHVDLYR